MNTRIHEHTFPNGIRIVYKQVPHTRIAHCGIMLDVGSRDETVSQQGIAHFWEHMAFKGTKTRKAFYINNEIESVGGELNAYTTKEKVCFYVSVLDKHYEKALDILKDITFNSIFPEKEIDKERGVILEEMAMILDSPEIAIQDDFESIVFNKHPLGSNILGTRKNINTFKKNDFQKFIQNNISTEKLIFSSVGSLPFKKVKDLAEKYLKNITVQNGYTKRIAFNNYNPKNLTKKTAISQAHCMIGCTAYETTNEKLIPFYLLVNLLGGTGMNSRLNLVLREKYSFVYTVEANYSSFTDTGLFGIYFGTEKKHLKKSISLVLKEIKKLKEKPLGKIQLYRAKEQFLGQLAMAQESNISLMLMMGRSLLDMDRIESLNEIFSKIKRITSRHLQDIANEIFVEDKLSYMTYLPE